MTKRKRRRLFFRFALIAALLVGSVRGWVRGVGAGQEGSRGDGFTVRIDSEEIGVRLNSWTGEVAVLDGAGYHWVLPGASEVFRLSRTPITLTFGGEEGHGALPSLTVRSADGSGFFFQEVRLTFRVSDSGALKFLYDSGTDSRLATDWVMALARPILREEFGAHTAQEVTDAMVCDEARGRAAARIGEELLGHGIELLEITASKPSFDRAYETAIAQRKVADQEVERLGEQLSLKLRERDERLVKTEAEILTRDGMQAGEIARLRIEAQTEAVKARGQADAWAIKRRGDGLIRQSELLAQASTMQKEGELQAAAFTDELAALEGRGALVIREKLVDSLAKTTFKLTPFAGDPSPERVERVTLSQGDL